MLRHSFKIRPKQASRYLDSLTVVAFQAVFLIINIGYIGYGFELKGWQPLAASLILSAIAGLAVRQYFSSKLNNLALMIDKDGIRTNSNFLNKLPNSTPISLTEIDRIEYTENLIQAMMGKYLTKADPYLKDYNKCLIIHASQKTKFGQSPKKFIIAQNMWQINDFNKLIAFFTTMGMPITQPTNNQQVIKENFPQMQDLGKRSGYLAYACLFLMVIAGGLLIYVDTFMTLEFGNIQFVAMVVACVIAIMGGYYLYSENNDIKGFVVLPLFVLMATFFMMSVVLVLSPMAGKEMRVDFDIKGGKWHSEYNQIPLEIECKKNKTNTASDGKVTIIDSLGMIRISFDELETLCNNGEFQKN